MATPTTTALLPIDPAVSPQQIARVLPIRANLLPTEITAGRRARRVRIALIGAVLAVVVVMGLWYFYAVQQKATATENLEVANDQVRRAQQSKAKHTELTRIINEQEAITKELKTLLANDLPWAKTLDTVRSTGTAAGVTVTEIVGTISVPQNGSAGDAVVTLSVTGSGSDKKTVALFVERLAEVKGMTDPYLSTATQNEDKVDFALTVELTPEAFCGRFTTACKTGGN